MSLECSNEVMLDDEVEMEVWRGRPVAVVLVVVIAVVVLVAFLVGIGKKLDWLDEDELADVSSSVTSDC